MKNKIKSLVSKLPFALRFSIEKNIYHRVDEVEIVYNVLKKGTGVMIDVGAHFGGSLKPFMKDNWSIHAFEPDPQNRQKLLETIKARNNVFLSTDAVTNESDLELAFFTSDVSTGISGLSKFHHSHKETHKVKTVTLKDYINSRKIPKIDFLKIDTEGHDLFVLQGFDWETHPHPRVIVCEFEDKKTIPLGYTTKDMYHFLKDKGYTIIVSEWFPIIEYGGAHQWKQFTKELHYSSDGWGNLIAIHKNLETAFDRLCK